MGKRVAVAVPGKCEGCGKESDALERSGYTPETPNHARICLLSAEQVKERSILPLGRVSKGGQPMPRAWLPGKAPTPQEYRHKMLCERCKSIDDGENAEPIDLDSMTEGS